MLVLLAPGAEEIECTVVVDVLRRAGLDVTLAGLNGKGPVRCSRGVMLVPDAALWEVSGQFALIVLPGGAEGASALGAAPTVGELLRRQLDDGRRVAAICAAPTALAKHGLGAGRRMTVHPSAAEQLRGHADVCTDPVVVDGNLVTGSGPGASFAFALELVRQLCGDEKARSVAQPMGL